MATNRDDIIQKVTRDYLSQIDKKNPPTYQTIKSEILEEVGLYLDAENQIRPKSAKWRIPDTLSAWQIAQIILTLYDIRSIALVDTGKNKKTDFLGVYMTTGENEGVFIEAEEMIENIAEKYNSGLTMKQHKEVFAIVQRNAIRTTRCEERNLIALRNGIFDYDTKQLLPFTPEKVFITKSGVNYNPNAVNVVIHNDDDGTDWDVESWMNELSDDKEIVDLLWKLLGAVIRPLVNWDRSAWLYSTSGSNGKGTLCALMRHMCGTRAHVSIALSDFGKDFMADGLVEASAIIVDENEANGAEIDKAATWKSVVTGDRFRVNIKYSRPIDVQFKGFMVQCLNAMPKIRDKSDSFYRRQLFVPFDKTFTGKERKYIKHDYLKRPEVLEYVLYKVLVLIDDYYDLPTPKACANALEEYKEFNDPVREFANTILPQLKWSLAPFGLVHQMYKAWFERSCEGNPVGKQRFIEQLFPVLKEHGWKCEDKKKTYAPKADMDVPEPLIAEYDLKDWMNPMYMSSGDVNKKCIPVLKANYRGIIRSGSEYDK